MKSGMLAAEAAFARLTAEKQPEGPIILSEYEKNLKDSWVWKELWAVRNFRPGFEKFGLYGGSIVAGLGASSSSSYFLFFKTCSSSYLDYPWL